MKIEFGKSRVAALKCGVAVSALLVAGTAYAQGSAPVDDTSADAAEIVVTGTLVRGIAPPGTNVIGVTSKAVEESGASSTAQLLEKIPQLGSFNDFQAPVAASNFVTTNRPNLRNLPGFTTAGSSPTLVLVDGHRVVGAGISVTSPDPDIIPPGAIERVEIVPDGGSAIYGSDAVAGVINFITKKKYDGISIDGHYGFADNYTQWDASVSAGHSWTGGSIYIAYNYSQHSELLGRDRDWVFYPKTTIDGIQATSFQCQPGNVTVANLAINPPTQTFALDAAGARIAGTTNQCDESDNASIYPQERRHSVLAGLSQELSDSLTFDVRAFYTHRDIRFTGGPYVSTIRFGPASLANFGFQQSPIFDDNRVGGVFGTFGFEAQTVYTSWGANNANNTHNRLSTWGVAPSFTAKLGSNWQLRWLASYGESETRFDGYNFNQTALTAAVSAGLFNPYNPSASDPVALAGINNSELYGRTRQRQFNTRLVLDGDLFQLPGGAVKLATGVEYNHDTFIARNGTIVPGTEDTGYAGLTVNGFQIVADYGPLEQVNVSRNVKSLFGELVIPIFGADNATGGFQELTLSVAGRYDKYSDVGDTFNPKVGLTWKPVDALRIRGSWGKSFVAPSLADDSRTAVNSITFTDFPFLKPTADQENTTINGVLVPAVGGRLQAILLGNKPGIQSQNAETWSVGADFDVPFASGLRLSATYWNIKYNNLIALPPFTTSTFYANFVGTSAITFTPTQAQIDALVDASDQVNGASCGGNCYVIIDARKQNVQNIKLSGLDLAVNYFTETGFGSLDFSLNANYDLTRSQQASANAPYIDQIAANASRLRFRTSVGAQIGGLRAQVALNRNHGYDLVPAVGVGVTQTRVSSFNVVDLFFKYDFSGEGMAKGLALSLNVNNVFDQDPPVYLNQNALTPGTNGFANGRTLGRLVQFGVSKKF